MLKFNSAELTCLPRSALHCSEQPDDARWHSLKLRQMPRSSIIEGSKQPIIRRAPPRLPVFMLAAPPGTFPLSKLDHTLYNHTVILIIHKVHTLLSCPFSLLHLLAPVSSYCTTFSLIAGLLNKAFLSPSTFHYQLVHFQSSAPHQCAPQVRIILKFYNHLDHQYFFS